MSRSTGSIARSTAFGSNASGEPSTEAAVIRLSPAPAAGGPTAHRVGRAVERLQEHALLHAGYLPEALEVPVAQDRVADGPQRREGSGR